MIPTPTRRGQSLAADSYLIFQLRIHDLYGQRKGPGARRGDAASTPAPPARLPSDPPAPVRRGACHRDDVGRVEDVYASSDVRCHAPAGTLTAVGGVLALLTPTKPAYAQPACQRRVPGQASEGRRPRPLNAGPADPSSLRPRALGKRTWRRRLPRTSPLCPVANGGRGILCFGYDRTDSMDDHTSTGRTPTPAPARLPCIRPSLARRTPSRGSAGYAFPGPSSVKITARGDARWWYTGRRERESSFGDLWGAPGSVVRNPPEKGRTRRGI